MVERVFRESGSFNFTSGERIDSADDVAYIFSALEDAAKEHSFVVLVKDGKPMVVELGMGTFTATMVDIPTASLADNRIRPDEVYFVHNHPSGNLICSQQDVKMLQRMAELSEVPEDVIFGKESDEQGRKFFYFLSSAEGGAYNLLEVYADRKGNLTSKTFYKTKKTVPQRVLSLKKSEHLTSVTDGASLLSGAKIPLLFENKANIDKKM